MIRYELITDATVEPVTLDEARKHVRVDNTEDDSLITNLIKAARRYCEKYTSRAFVNQIWLVYYDFKDFLYKKELYLNLGKIQVLNSITTYDSDGVAAIVDPANYVVSGNRINFVKNYYFNNTEFRNFDSLQINYTVGYGATAALVPQDLKEAILLLVGHWYENRGAIYESTGGKSDQEVLPLGVLNLLDARKIYIV